MLWSTLAVEDCRIFLVRIKVGGKDLPAGHLFAIGGRHDHLLHFAKFQLVEKSFIGSGELLYTLLVDGIHLIGLTHGVAQGDGILIVDRSDGGIVILPGGDGVDTTVVDIDRKHRFCSLVVSGEPYLLAILTPGDILGPIVPIFS